MQSKFLKIVLAWIGAFFCAWLFGNKMLDTPLPPPLFFLAAILYTSVMLAKDKVETVIKFRNGRMYEEEEKISVFESVFVKISCLWVGIFLYLIFFGSNTKFFLLLTIFYIGLIYAPLILLGYKYVNGGEEERGEKILRRLSAITYIFFILPYLFALYPDHVNGIIEHWDVRFYQGILVSIIFYFLAKFTLYQWYDALLMEMTFNPVANYMAIFFGIYWGFVSFFVVATHALD